MINRSLGVFLAVALLLASAVPAYAQFSVGLSLLSEDGGPGVNVDYSAPFKTLAMDRTLGWLVDASVNHKSIGGISEDLGITTVMAGGGVRWAGKAGTNGTFHVQGSAGIFRVNASFDDDTQAICDLVGVDCDASETSFVITPAGAYTYWFSPTRGVKGQVNFPIDVDGGGNAARVDINFVMKLGQ